jgi:hypothetical protein
MAACVEHMLTLSPSPSVPIGILFVHFFLSFLKIASPFREFAGSDLHELSHNRIWSSPISQWCAAQGHRREGRDAAIVVCTAAHGHRREEREANTYFLDAASSNFYLSGSFFFFY